MKADTYLGDVGDIIQCEGQTVPRDLRDKFFIIRALAPDVVLSWPYCDQGCTLLYVPREPLQSERDWQEHCRAVERKEKAANKAMGVTLRRQH